MAIGVVYFPLLRISQDLIRLGAGFELLFRLFVVRVSVRVEFHRQFAIGLFDLTSTGASTDRQDFVIINTHILLLNLFFLGEKFGTLIDNFTLAIFIYLIRQIIDVVQGNLPGGYLS